MRTTAVTGVAAIDLFSGKVKQAQIRESEVTNESGCIPKQVACCALWGERARLVPEMAGQICRRKAADSGFTACHRVSGD